VSLACRAAQKRGTVIAILADTHLPRGQRRLPEPCLERLRAADLILHAGDISTARVLDELSALGPAVLAVHGNVDEPALSERLPEELQVELDGVSLAMTHDAGPAKGRLARLGRRFPRADAVVFGHSHIPLLEAEDGFQIFNPGSPTDRRRQTEHTMGLARIERGTIVFELVSLGA
jgi:putative phosphoesterase